MKQYKHIQRLKPAFTLLLLLALFTVQFTLFAFGHFHIDENGHTIYHAHATGRSGATHTHNHSDMAALNHMLLSLTVLLLALLLFWLTPVQSSPNSADRQHFIVLRLWRYAITHRGPPVALQLR